MSSEALQVAVGVVSNPQGEILIAFRPESVHQGNCWEFPGGKLESEETDKTALIRELKEELGLTVKRARPLISINHQYPDLRVKLWVWKVDEFVGSVSSNEGQPIRWVPVDALKSYSFPVANQTIVKAIQLPSQYAIIGDDDLTTLKRKFICLVDKRVNLIQLRAKLLSTADLQRFLEFSTAVCTKNKIRLMINSSLCVPDVFLSNLHLTAKDLMTTKERPKGVEWLGASCHSYSELQHAEAIGVDFAVLAPVSKTSTHPDAKPLGWECFKSLVGQVNIPVYALGGMTDSDLVTAYECGAQGIAGIRAFSP